MAAPRPESSAAAARYQQERAVCLGNRSNQDRATCLREAGAALAEARRGGLDDNAASYQSNALKRCAQLPDASRLACEARMQGQGSVRGSAAAGGIYRELSTPEPSPATP